MKIKDISASWLRVPLSRPLSDSTHELTCIDWIVVEVRDAECSGRSCMLSFDFAPSLMKRFVESELKPHLLGVAAGNIRAVYERCLQLTEYVGTGGLAMWATAGIETALWDLLARKLGVPAARLFGQYAERVPVYGSGGWISYSDEELADELDSYVSRGFRAVKIKIGGFSEAWDLDRLHARCGRRLRPPGSHGAHP